MRVLVPKKLESSPQGEWSSAPPLMAGDHLHVDQFVARYQASPEFKKAELIEGIVYMPPPVYDEHSVPDNIAAGWISYYFAHTPGTRAHNDRTLQLIGHTQVQPDVCLVLLPQCNGKTYVNERKELAGSPELIFEVAASSASYDLFEKKRAYHANQVREYLVWQTLDSRFDWFDWTPAEYVRRTADAKGLVKSRQFPGLWMNVSALLREKYDLVMKTLEQGVRSPEHKRFAAELTAQLRRKR